MNAEPVNSYQKSASPVKPGPKYETLLLSLLAIVVILIYTDTLTTPLIFDDIRNIRDNPHIRVSSLSLKNLTRAGFQSPESSRPVANISFALNYYFNGFNLVGFHLVNILIHIFGGIFLYFCRQSNLKDASTASPIRKMWLGSVFYGLYLAGPSASDAVGCLPRAAYE